MERLGYRGSRMELLVKILLIIKLICLSLVCIASLFLLFFKFTSYIPGAEYLEKYSTQSFVMFFTILVFAPLLGLYSGVLHGVCKKSFCWLVVGIILNICVCLFGILIIRAIFEGSTRYLFDTESYYTTGEKVQVYCISGVGLIITIIETVALFKLLFSLMNGEDVSNSSAASP